MQVRGTVNSPSGGASRRIALRNGETDTPTPLRSDPVPEEEALPQAACGWRKEGEGVDTGASGGELHPRVMTRPLAARAPWRGWRVIPYGTATPPTKLVLGGGGRRRRFMEEAEEEDE